MASTILVVLVGLMGIGLIGASLVALHHLLARKDKQVTFEQLKTQVIPELESMTIRMMDKTMDMLPEKCIDLTKKMLKAQREFEEEEY